MNTWGKVLARRVQGAADPAADIGGLSRKDLRVLVRYEAEARPESDVLALALCEAAARYLKSKKRTRSK